jgi:hypothetical protein
MMKREVANKDASEYVDIGGDGYDLSKKMDGWMDGSIEERGIEAEGGSQGRRRSKKARKNV